MSGKTFKQAYKDRNVCTDVYVCVEPWKLIRFVSCYKLYT